MGATYFRQATWPDYHRPWAISLPCSEWEGVEQAQYGPHSVEAKSLSLIASQG